jgi:DNA-binding transcriptional LysR family regulator
MAMQLHQLRYFLGVAEEANFTRAAARLNVAQPSVSSAVRDLERELGAALFHRSRGAVVLSAAGEALRPWARQVIADCDAGRSAVRDLIELGRGSLAIGATPSLTVHLLPPVLAGFHRRYPGIDLHLREDGSQLLVDRLEQGELDLALVILPTRQSWVQTRALAVEELVLAIGPGHRLAHRATVSLAELRDVPLVMFRDRYDLRRSTLAACRWAGFEPVLAIEGLEMDGVLAMTAAGVGAAIVPESMVPEGGALRALRFSDDHLVRTIGLASRRDRPLSVAANAFVAELESRLAGDPGPHRPLSRPAMAPGGLPAPSS